MNDPKAPPAADQTPTAAPVSRWERQSDATAHLLVANLLRALEPFVVAVAPSLPPSMTAMHVEVMTGAPTVAEVVYVTAAGPGERLVAVGSGQVGDLLALAMGAIVERGLNQFPPNDRRRLAPLVEAGAVRLRLDPVFLQVEGWLEALGHAPVQLFALHGQAPH